MCLCASFKAVAFGYNGSGYRNTKQHPVPYDKQLKKAYDSL